MNKMQSSGKETFRDFLHRHIREEFVKKAKNIMPTGTMVLEDGKYLGREMRSMRKRSYLPGD